MTERRGPSEGESRVYLPNNVSLTIFYSPHSTREDLGDYDEFRGMLRSSDIYLPERVWWTQKDLNIDRQISQGNPAALAEAYSIIERAPEHAGFSRAVEDALFGSHVRVMFVDVPHDSPEGQRELDALKMDIEQLYTGSFEDAIKFMEEHYRGYGAALRGRDEYITRRIGPALKQEIESNYKFKKKDAVRVFMTLGGLHRSVGELLSKASSEARERSGSSLPEVIIKSTKGEADFGSQLLMGIDSGNDNSLLLAKRLAQTLMGRAVRDIAPSLSYNELIHRLDNLDIGEIENAYYFMKALMANDELVANRYYPRYMSVLKKLLTA